eukprot:SAG22_NODE_136_length_18095_cov_19.897255_10_plen_50_part_00
MQVVRAPSTLVPNILCVVPSCGRSTKALADEGIQVMCPVHLVYYMYIPP